MNNDPADARAWARKRVGATRELEQTRATLPHPSRGGTRGYPTWFRVHELQQHAQGLPTVASAPSLHRWRNRLNPHRMTGNKEAETLVGYDQFLLCLYSVAYPEASADEIAAFIYRNGGNLYSRSAITTRFNELEITRKVSSTEAHQAYLPQNVFKAQVFWNHPPPLGVVGIPRSKLLDFDEAGFSLEKVNRKRGRATKGIRVRKRGHYTRDKKITVRVAISPGDPNLPAHVYGSIENPRRWLEVSHDAGTTADDHSRLCETVMNDLDTSEPGNDTRFFLWDNLISHHSPIVFQTVYGHQGPRRYQIIPRPPYQPKWAPVEYFFCQLADRLRDRLWYINSLNDLEREIRNIVPNLSGIDGTFQDCGYL